jgi:predicted transcriptional regulator
MNPYAEEIYERAESMFITDAGKMSWLKGFDKAGKNKYEQGGVEVLGYLTEAEGLRADVKKEDDVDRLLEIKEDATSLPFYGEDIPDEVDKKLTQLAMEEEKERNEQISEEIADYYDRVDDVKSLSEEEQRELYKSGSREERELAGVALGEISPNTLRSIKGWETRKGRTALRNWM